MAMDEQKIKELRVLAQQIRIDTLCEFKAIGFGHIGGSMSIAEVLAVLYGSVMKINPKQPDCRYPEKRLAGDRLGSTWPLNWPVVQ